MKAPKINKYANGGPTDGGGKYAKKKMTAAEWNEMNEKAGYLTYPGASAGSKGHLQYYNPKDYVVEKDPTTGYYGSIRQNMSAPETIELYTYDYQEPVSKMKTASPQRSTVAVDPNHKPLVIGTAGTYDPNTGVNYIDPSKQTGTNPVRTENYKSGGSIKAPFVKKKVAKYVNGTGVNGVQYDENNNPILSSQNTLGGSEIQTNGQSNFYQGYNRSVVDNTGADTQKKQGGGKFASNLGASMGWMQYANMAQTAVRSNIDKETVVDPETGKEVSSPTDKTGMVLEETAKPAHETWLGHLKDKNYSRLGRSILLTPAGDNLLYNKGIGNKDFEQAKYNAEQKQANEQAFAARDAGETMTGGNAAPIEKPKDRSYNLFGKNFEFKAQGGTIVGVGGPKDDAILSKVGKNGIEAGSFITPAENNHLAKAIRAKVLGDNPNKVAQFKKEGGEMKADVAVSNGEHLFTPKEKRKIMSHLGKEILEELAPNAEDEDKMNCGGKVKYAKGTPKGGVQKRTNSTGVSSVDKMIDDAYTNPPKTEKEWNDMVSKIKTLTRGRSSKDVNNFVTFANDNINRIKKSDEESYAKNKKLAEQGGDIVSNIKKLKELGASDKLIKQYTDDAKGLSGKESGFARNKTPNELFTYYRDRAEDEDISKNKENVKKGLDERVQANYKKLQDAKNNPQNYTPEQIEKIQSDFDSSAEYRDKLVGDIDKNDIKAYREAKSILSKKGSKSFPESEPAIKKGSKSFPESEPAIKKGSDLEDIKQSPADKLGGGKEYVMPTNLKDRGRGVSAPKIGGVKSSTVKGVEFSPKIAEEETSYPSVATEQGQPVIEATEFYKKPLNDTQADLLVKSAQSVKPETPKPETEKTGIGKYLGKNYGSLLETGAALGQLGMGLKATREQRPVDVIDPQFLANVNKAQAEAKYGFTAEENSLMDQERQQALNAARFAARNYSGGSPASAFNMERAAINDSYGSALKKAIANKSLQMSKQQYADAMSAQKAGMSRQLFNDKMNAWMQNQQAGGNLIGAGIRNIIGASRYQQELKAQQERNKYNNPGF